jgi:uncharacterized protein (TIGR02145 family)
MTVLKVLFAGLIAASTCMAITISGKITDTSGTPIPGAAVWLEQNGLPSTSGFDGTFTLTTAGINHQVPQSQPYGFCASVANGILFVNLTEKSTLDITVYDLQGCSISSIQKAMNAGLSSIVLPHFGSGIYLYKVESRNEKHMLRSISIHQLSQYFGIPAKGSSINSLAKQAKPVSAINDVIAVTKDGYLNYRVVVYNSDTSGIEIKMIVCADTVRDADGNLYHAVRIGNQVWTVENLGTQKYNDGSHIPHVEDSVSWANLTTPGYCYYKNMTSTDSIHKYGALYNWYAINSNKLAPIGWHVPSDSEWNSLLDYLIANGYNSNGSTVGNAAAKSLAARTDWIANQIATAGCGGPGNNLMINNKTGFSALPGGFRSNDDGGFYDAGSIGDWWSASEYWASPTRAIVDGIDNDDCSLRGDSYHTFLKGCGFSVRLVRD